MTNPLKHAERLDELAESNEIIAALEPRGEYDDVREAEAKALRAGAAAIRELEAMEGNLDGEFMSGWRAGHVNVSAAIDCGVHMRKDEPWADKIIALQARAEAAEKALGEAKLALEAIAEEADRYADVEDGDDGIANRPNFAMRVQMTAENALNGIDRAIEGGKG